MTRARISFDWRMPVTLVALMCFASACAAGADDLHKQSESFTAGAAASTGNGDDALAGSGAGQPTAGVGVFPAGIGGGSSTAGTGVTAGAVSSSGTGGTSGTLGSAGTSGMMGAAGMMDTAGTMGAAGTMDTAGTSGAAGTGATTMDGSCCSDGDCLCHSPPPSSLSAMNGPYQTESYALTRGTVYYPTDAEPPFAAIAICPGFLNFGPEMAPWGPFYASHGFVMIATHTGPGDVPAIRAQLLLGAVEELKGENTKADSRLFGKLSGRYGTSGYSMGGGGTTIAATSEPTLKTSVPLAAWGPAASGTQVPTLLLCGSSDTVAACSQSSSAYRQIPESTPKMMVTISGATHFNWFGPNDAGRGRSGSVALAFQKVFLDGDERWRPLLVGAASESGVETNIQ